jgi:hypothetical protein
LVTLCIKSRESPRNEEEAADCFVFICEKLAQNAFRRLLRFKPAGTASFSTWLRVVAKNLCFDWQRKVHGRPRPFQSLRGLGALDLEVYHCRYERGRSAEDTLRFLRSSWTALTAMPSARKTGSRACSALDSIGSSRRASPHSISPHFPPRTKTINFRWTSKIPLQALNPAFGRASSNRVCASACNPFLRELLWQHDSARNYLQVDSSLTLPTGRYFVLVSAIMENGRSQQSSPVEFQVARKR